MANDCVRHRLVFVAQDILISHLRLMVFQLVPYFPDILCVFGGIVFRCVHSKIDIWIRLSNGFPFRPVHTTSTMWRVMVAISEQFSVRFPSLTQKISQIKLQIELVLWIGRSFVFVAKHRNEYQKWEKRRERKKAILWSTSGRLMLSSKQVYTSLWQSRKRLLLKKQWQSQSKSQSNTNSVRWKFIVIRSDSHLP